MSRVQHEAQTNNGIMFSLPSPRSNHSNQMKIKDTGCQCHVHFGSEGTSDTLKVLFIIGSCYHRIRMCVLIKHLKPAKQSVGNARLSRERFFPRHPQLQAGRGAVALAVLTSLKELHCDRKSSLVSWRFPSLHVNFDQVLLFKGLFIAAFQLSHRHMQFSLEYHRCPLFLPDSPIEAIKYRRNLGNSSINCCCCSAAQSYLTLCDPMDCSTPGFPVLHHFLELLY